MFALASRGEGGRSPLHLLCCHPERSEAESKDDSVILFVVLIDICNS